MTNVARELLKKQFIELSRDAPSGCSVGLDDDANFFSWRVCFEGPPDTFYEGGIFQASLKFPPDFPNNPPEMVFEQDMWHPNGRENWLGRVGQWDCSFSTASYSRQVGALYSPSAFVFLLPSVFPDGRVCISILHPPGHDMFNEQEKAEERWRPILGVEAILLSVISMLGEPNIESPANVDAAVSESKRACSWGVSRLRHPVRALGFRAGGNMYKNNLQEYKKKVRAIARKSVEG
ncbi:ubiquitin-conjugating enzyme subfamily protein [Cyclospora cayetanensis]|uniref:Ubiquitin-conjugating enzyme subfamily protein n=1 Tax=Cyclospora cayetanensis TaxID=88456 RepID=A0A1D3CZE9_9EIME|nr:ubiquitin-conjugating enzyme subfamily protein [Cyclospora cayetanensis]